MTRSHGSLFDRRRFLSGIGAGAAGAVSAGGMRIPAVLRRAAPLGMRELAARLIAEEEDGAAALAAEQTRKGLSWRELEGAILLAGAQEVEPRPVGFKFHCVMMTGSVYSIGEGLPEPLRLQPVFFNLFDFKRSQRADAEQGGWSLGELPAIRGGDARARLVEALDGYDVDAADEAIVALHDVAGPDEVYDVLWRYGARDQNNIGHQAIFTLQSYRSLQRVGWVNAVPVLRSLVYALLDRGGEEQRAPFERNRERAGAWRADWLQGDADPAIARRVLDTARQGSAEENERAVFEEVQAGAPARAVWDGLRACAFERLMQRPDILTIHMVTSINALRAAFDTARRDATRRLLLLQAASWTGLFGRRFEPGGEITAGLDELEPAGGGATVEETFAALDDDRAAATRMALAATATPDGCAAFATRARELLARKAVGHHDHKFLAAALEEAATAPPDWRRRFLAASLGYLRGPATADGASYRRTEKLLAASGVLRERG